jgi:hypothetical protein
MSNSAVALERRIRDDFTADYRLATLNTAAPTVLLRLPPIALVTRVDLGLVVGIPYDWRAAATTLIRLVESIAGPDWSPRPLEPLGLQN